MPFIGVFDHHDVELSRKEHDCSHGHEKHCERWNVVRVFAGAVKGEQLGKKVGILCTETGKNIGKSVEQSIGDKQADGKHAGQFYQGFKRYRGDQAFVTFRRNQLAGTEDNTEQ